MCFFLKCAQPSSLPSKLIFRSCGSPLNNGKKEKPKGVLLSTHLQIRFWSSLLTLAKELKKKTSDLVQTEKKEKIIIKRWWRRPVYVKVSISNEYKIILKQINKQKKVWLKENNTYILVLKQENKRRLLITDGWSRTEVVLVVVDRMNGVKKRKKLFVLVSNRSLPPVRRQKAWYQTFRHCWSGDPPKLGN